ncbi:MAG: hypothetical protein RL722_1840, partial [Pseudomonadota bacterium]
LAEAQASAGERLPRWAWAGALVLLVWAVLLVLFGVWFVRLLQSA